MARISAFATDPEAELKGTWVEAGGMKLLIARMGNAEYTAYMRRAGKPLAPAIRAGTSNDKDVERLIKVAMSKHVLLDWRNVEDDDKPVPYSPEKALEFFERYPDFHRMITEIANDAANFKKQVKEDELGN